MKRKLLSPNGAEAAAVAAACSTEDGHAAAAPDALQQISDAEATAGREAAGHHRSEGEEEDPVVRSAPTLPWMRVPLAIEGGASVPLEVVLGLQECLRDGLRDGAALRLTLYSGMVRVCFCRLWNSSTLGYVVQPPTEA